MFRWTHEVPGCRKTCKVLSAVQNADVFPPQCDQPVLFEGMSCSYTCHNGFQLVGSQVRSCIVNENWTGDESKCVRTCNPLFKPPHGNIVPNFCASYPQLAFGNCFFKCNMGFELKGKVNLTCSEYGFWSEQQPDCVAKCPSLKFPDNGNLQCTGNKRDATCVLHCLRNFRLRGSGFVTCGKDGVWSEPLGVCHETCPKLIAPRHGTVLPKECSMVASSTNATCSVLCDRSYGILGPFVTTCLKDRSWSGGRSECVFERQYMLTLNKNDVNICLATKETKNSEPQKREINLCSGSTFEYWFVNQNGLIKNAGNGKCIGFNPPADLAKLVFLHCNDSDPRQLWEFSSRMSALKMRHYPYFISYGYSSASEVIASERESSFSRWFLFNLNTLTKSSFFGALNNGQCPTLQRYENGLWYPRTCWTQPSAHGSSCTFVCAPGFGSANKSTVVICRSGIWAESNQISCFQSCPAFNQFSFANGTVTPSECLSNNYVDRETTCTFSCGNSFVLEGEQNVACLTNGRWSAPLPQCHISCPPLLAPSNGVIVATELCKNPLAMQRSGSLCKITCDIGYILSGTAGSICKNDGTWNDTTTQCVRACFRPDLPINGRVICNETKTFYPTMTTCSYNCSDGATLHPDIENTTCLSSGTWNNHPPACQYFCPTFLPLANGKIEPSICSKPNESLPNNFKCSFSCHLNFSLNGVKDIICLDSGKWSDDFPVCQPDIQFVLVHELRTMPLTCILVQEYPFHNGFKVGVAPYSECNSSNPLHLWSVNFSNRIRNVATGWCLSALNKAEKETLVLVDCDSSHEMAQRWISALEENVTTIRLKLTNTYLQQQNDHPFVAMNYANLENLHWSAYDTSGNRGTLFGMQMRNSASCPKLTLPPGTNIVPLSCLVLVIVGNSCNISCESEYMLLSGRNSTVLRCNNFGVWSTTDIYCKKRQCSFLPSVASTNGTLISNAICTTNNFPAFSTTPCSYSCASGYYLDLPDGITGTLYCLGLGKWSESVPQCVQYCRALTMPSNGHVIPSVDCTSSNRANTGLVCAFLCQPHYQLQGASYLECKAGNWNGTEPTCIALSGSGRCGGFPSINNARLNPTICYNRIVPFNTTCRIACNPGYAEVLIRYNNIICQANSKWSSSLPRCKKICPLFPAPVNGDLKPHTCRNGTITEGHFCSVVCRKGYSLTSASRRTCLSTGNWDSSRANCMQKEQFMLQLSNNCAYAPNGMNSYVYFDACVYDDMSQWWEWVDNRRIRNVKTGTCLKPAELQSYSSIRLIDCDLVKYDWDCPYSSNMAEGLVYNEMFQLAKTTVSPSSSAFIVNPVEDDAQWIPLRTTDLLAVSNDNVTARPCLFRSSSKCPRLAPFILNGVLEEHCRHDGVNVLVGTSCKYFCNDGFTLVGNAERQCQADGEWSNTNSVQCKITCPPLITTEASFVNPRECTKQSMPEGSSCNFSCESGFFLAGSRVRYCQPDGTWSGISTLCHKQCSALQISSEMTVSPQSCAVSNQFFGTVCRASCPFGFSLIGSSINTCQFSGSWTGMVIGCQRSCKPLPTLQNGKILPKDCVQPNKHAGNTCVYSCNPLYGIRGNRMRTCTQEGLWSGSSPKCLRRCPVLSESSNGEISCTQDQPLVGDTCTVSCDPEYVVQGANETRTCLETSQWSGTKLICKKEVQFMIIQGSPKSIEKCLFVMTNNMISIANNNSCIFSNSSVRWAWNNGNLIRHSSSRLCLSGNVQNIQSYLVLKECNISDPTQLWECSDPEKSWFIRLIHLRLYPLFSPLSADNVLLFSYKTLNLILNGSFAVHRNTQWYAKSSSSARMSVCASRKADGCNPFPMYPNVVLTPATCLTAPMPIGTSCYFSCASNFVLDRQIVLTECLVGGLWSRMPPKCLPGCKPFSLRDADSLNINPPTCSGAHQLPETFACRFFCPPNMIFVGNPVLTCQRNSQWNYQMPKCRATCPTLNALQHGRILPERCTVAKRWVIEGTDCKYECLQSEHTLSGASKRSCTNKGTWNMPEGKCVKPCPILRPSAGGNVSPPRCSLVPGVSGDVCTFSCNINKTLKGSAFTVCLPNGTWTGGHSTCQADCPILQAPKNAIIIPNYCLVSHGSPGQSCTLSCVSGYEARGNKITVCMKNGNWSHDFGKCTRRCGKLYKPNNGVIEPKSCLSGNIYLGKECSFSCENGYVLQGSAVRSCLSNGKWSGTETKCTIACAPLGPGLNINYSPNSCKRQSQAKGLICSASCASGMLTRNGLSNSLAQCDSKGNWNVKSIKACYPTCRRPNIANGETKCFQENGKLTFIYTTSTVCKVSCNTDFVVTSNALSKCESNVGNLRLPRWNPPLATCEHEPDPMLIINRVRYDAVCLGVDHKRVILVDWLQCKNASRNTKWVWHNRFQIRNSVSGYCLEVSQFSSNTYVTTSTCRSQNIMQRWTCSGEDPYLVRPVEASIYIDTSFRHIHGVVLTKEKLKYSKLYTYNPQSKSGIGTLCSRRSLYIPADICVLPTLPFPAVFQQIDCYPSNGLKPGSTCTVICNASFRDKITCQADGFWNPPAKSLCKHPCQAYTSLSSNAEFAESVCSAGLVPFGTLCTLRCRNGFTLMGNIVGTKCMHGGLWKPLNSYTCVRGCPKIKPANKGFLIPKSCVTGVCRLVCLPGYRVKGPQSRTCLSNGRWSGTSFSCVAETQFSIMNFLKYKLHTLCLEADRLSVVVKAKCAEYRKFQRWRWNSHFTIENIATRQCLAIDDINIQNVTTSRRISAVTNGTYANAYGDNIIPLTLFNNEQRKVITKTCDATDFTQRWNCGNKKDVRLHLASLDIYLDASALFRPNLWITNTTNSKGINWLGRFYDQEMSVCAYRRTGICPSLDDIPNGEVLPGICKSNFVILGTRCAYICRNGYTLTGHATTVCLKKGRWTHPPPACLGKTICPSLQLYKSLFINPLRCTTGVVAEGQVCDITCNNAKLLDGSKQLTCLLDGSWNGNIPKCNVVCPAIRPPNAGFIEPEQCEKGNLPVSFVCNYECLLNRTLFGTANRTCLSDGTWKGQQTTCEQYCPPLNNLRNGKINPMQCTRNTSGSGEVCDMQCNIGYSLSGKTRITCIEGKWSGTLAVCSQDYCSPIAANLHTEKIVYSGLVNGAIVPTSVVNISCNPGYHTFAPHQRVCLPNGEWSSGSNTCQEIRCPVLTKLYNGIVSPSGCVEATNGVPVGKVCYFSCRTGYDLKGIISKECLSDGYWSYPEFMIACLDTLPKLYLSTFNIQLLEELDFGEKRTRCIQASSDSNDVFYKTCLSSNFYQRWKWLGAYLLQSVGSQKCLSLQEKVRKVREVEIFEYHFSLENCTDSETSLFHCGDVSSKAGRYQLFAGNILLNSQAVSEDRTVHLISWSGEWVDYTRETTYIATPQRSNDRMPICSFMCGGNIKADEGDFSSPNYPNKYKKNVECVWVIEARTPSQELVVDFSFVSLKSDYSDSFGEGECGIDYLEIVEEQNSGRNLLARLCTDTKPVRFSTFYDRFRITFFSGNTKFDNGRGWSAHWWTRRLPNAMSNCGRLNTNQPVASGVRDSPTAAPWQVLVIHHEQDFCNGAIYNSYFVIVAASCIENFPTIIGRTNGQQVLVMYNFNNQADLIRRVQENIFNAARKIWLHPNYTRSLFQNDIALVMTWQKIVFESAIQPICFPSFSQSRVVILGYARCWAVQWSRDVFTHKHSRWDYTHYSYVILLKNQDCAEILHHLKYLDQNKNFICARETEYFGIAPPFLPRPLEAKHSNNEGNILQCNWNGNWFLIGISSISFSDDLDQPVYVYTGIDAHKNWIVDTTAKSFYSLRDEYIKTFNDQ